MIEAEAVRWVGMLTALGVLIPISLWFALPALGARARNVVAALSGVTLAIVAAGAIGAMSVTGYTLATVTSDVNEGDEGRGLLAVALAIVGLAVGLAVALTLRSRDDVAAAEEPATVEDEPPFEEEPPVADDSAAPGDAYWASHAGEAVPFAAPVAPVGAATLTLLLIAVALALPSSRFHVGPGVLGLDGEVGGAEAAGMVLEGVRHGLALLLAAVALRGRDAVAVAASFGLVALGQGLATAFPDTFGNEFWFMFATGLTAGLILPPALRLLTPALVADRAAFATGVAVVAALLAAQSWASSTAVYDDNFSVIDSDVRVPVVPGQIPVPTFSFEPPVLPSDFPSFVVPSFVVPSFVVPTFQFPSGFPPAPSP